MGDGTRETPYTREDVLERIKKNDGQADGLDLSGKIFEESIDLRGLDLGRIILKNAVFLVNVQLELANSRGAQLDRADLRGAYLEGAFLEVACLEGADLRNAHLEGASLGHAHLEGAFLDIAHLERVSLVDAHLEGAILQGTHLEGAFLGDAHLEGADLSNAHLDGASLHGAQFSADTRLETVDWGNYALGEEKGEAFHWAVETYRRLKMWYTHAGYSDIAAKFYYREKEVNRKGLKLFSRSSWRHRLTLEFIYRGWGYGEEWKRLLFGWIPGVILVLAAAYYFWGSFSPSSFWDTLYYSAASFTALGYGNWAPQPTGWAKGMGAVEAIIGVFMMALLLVTFVRKWTR